MKKIAKNIKASRSSSNGDTSTPVKSGGSGGGSGSGGGTSGPGSSGGRNKSGSSGTKSGDRRRTSRSPKRGQQQQHRSSGGIGRSGDVGAIGNDAAYRAVGVTDDGMTHNANIAPPPPPSRGAFGGNGGADRGSSVATPPVGSKSQYYRMENDHRSDQYYNSGSTSRDARSSERRSSIPSSESHPSSSGATTKMSLQRRVSPAQNGRQSNNNRTNGPSTALVGSGAGGTSNKSYNNNGDVVPMTKRLQRRSSPNQEETEVRRRSGRRSSSSSRQRKQEQRPSTPPRNNTPASSRRFRSNQMGSLVLGSDSDCSSNPNSPLSHKPQPSSHQQQQHEAPPMAIAAVTSLGMTATMQPVYRGHGGNFSAGGGPGAAVPTITTTTRTFFTTSTSSARSLHTSGTGTSTASLGRSLHRRQISTSVDISRHYELNNQFLNLFDTTYKNQLWVVAYEIGRNFVETALFEIPKHGYYHSQRHADERAKSLLDTLRVTDLLNVVVERMGAVAEETPSKSITSATTPSTAAAASASRGGQQDPITVDEVNELRSEAQKLNQTARERAREVGDGTYERYLLDRERVIKDAEHVVEMAATERTNKRRTSGKEREKRGSSSSRRSSSSSFSQDYSPKDNGGGGRTSRSKSPSHGGGGGTADNILEGLENLSFCCSSSDWSALSPHLVPSYQQQQHQPAPPPPAPLHPQPQRVVPKPPDTWSGGKMNSHVTPPPPPNLYLTDNVSTTKTRQSSDSSANLYPTSFDVIPTNNKDSPYAVMIDPTYPQDDMIMGDNSRMGIGRDASNQYDAFLQEQDGGVVPEGGKRYEAEVIPVVSLRQCYWEDWQSLKNQDKVQFTFLETYQGRIPASTNGCTVIAPLLAIHHLQSEGPSIADSTIDAVIDTEASTILPEVRSRLGLTEDALIIPSDVHDYLIELGLIGQDQFVGVVGGNIMDDGHMNRFIRMLNCEREHDCHRGKKVAAALFFHAHVVSILKIEFPDGRRWYDLIDSMPSAMTLTGTMDEDGFAKCAVRIRCKTLESLLTTLKWFSCSKFHDDDCNYIDMFQWEDSRADFDPRVFQAFVWAEWESGPTPSWQREWEASPEMQHASRLQA